jgi:GNAT superfamily N-acetyltransferase
MDDSFECRFARAAELHRLRRDILRGADPDATVALPRDDDPDVWHLAATASGIVVGCASFYPVSCEWASDLTPATQLRFMAVEPTYQGRGVGTALLDMALAELRRRGMNLLWANARDTALGFYLGAGFSTIEGSGFIPEDTGLSHTVVIKPL